ncbi:MAG: phospho-sugar mutase [Bacteroidales bacterium]|nr:phospho-sugar mutase [Candidatus Cryptobacteroides caccocaballi]
MADYMNVVQSWLDGNYDQQTKGEILRLRNNDPVALEDAFYRKLEFGTGGLRGKMGVGTNRMNKYTVGMATQGLANYIKKNVEGDDIKVCISYDSRNNSKLFAKITADVLSANGLHVYIFDNIRPTPELSYSIRKVGALAGVMVTASHNPKEYNGYKVFWADGGQITSPVDKDIVAEVNAINDPSEVKFDPSAVENPGTVELMGAEMDESYLSDILSLTLSPEAVAKHTDLKMVYTPLHGTGVRIARTAIERLGFKNVYHVIEQDMSDGDFPTVKSPNPEETAAMQMALDEADKVGAELVMATDPDADRMGIAVRDNEGKMVLLNGNQTASILTYYILTRWSELGKLNGKQYIVKTIVTTELLPAIAAKFGVKTYNVLTGFKYIAEVVKKNEGVAQFVCGGEESYGFNIGEFVRDKDAPVACAMVAECAAWCAEQGMTLYQFLQKIYAEIGYYKENMKYIVREGKAGAEEIDAMMADFRQNPPKEIAGCPVVEVKDYNQPEKTGLPKSNVLQFFSKDGDVVTVRPSGTEPKIKFYFGAKGADADAKIEALKSQFIK